MAGGSADAAAALVALDRLWGLDTSDDDLLRLAGELGSDVPFALLGGTALGTGRGELVEPVSDPATWWWVVVPSGAGLSTPAVYRRYDALDPDAPPEPETARAVLLARSRPATRSPRAALHNDLEAAALDLRPDLAELLEAGEEVGALRGLVSGSGPTCVFLAADADHARSRGRRSERGVRRRARRQRPGRRRARGHLCLVRRRTSSTSSGCRSRTASAPCSTDVSLGVAAGERIGVVGRNGDGKTTLLNVMTGLAEPDSGRVSRSGGCSSGYLRQHDELVDTHTVREAVLGGRSDHEWAADPRTREVVEVLLAGVALTARSPGCPAANGGAARWPRCCWASTTWSCSTSRPTTSTSRRWPGWPTTSRGVRLPWSSSPTTAGSSTRCASGRGRCTTALVDVYEGGYAAYVLAQAERQRQAAASEVRRRNLVRKELAWLRRGPPARTSKPKFRIDAANALIEDVPPPRDRLELQRFATQRLGKDVIDIEDVDLVRGDRVLLSHATWRLGPGDRVGLVGVNGAGKTSVLGLLAGELAPSAGRVRHGRTVALAHLTQQLDELDPAARVLDTVEAMRRVTRTADGEITASALLERFGFTGDRLTARLGDLSGGERRRFQLLRLLLTEPNVLLLDEPTNDLDIETLTVLEDFLDGWPGTLVVVSHDRYFLERTVDSVWALLDDGQISMLPRGVDEYLERRAAALAPSTRRRRGRACRDRRSTEHPGRPRARRRGARGPQGAGPDRPAARAGRRTRGRAERRDRRGRPGLRRLAELGAELDGWPPRRTRSSWSGSRSPSSSSRELSADAERRQQLPQQPGQRVLLAGRQLGEQRLLGVDQRGERAVDGGLALPR